MKNMLKKTAEMKAKVERMLQEANTLNNRLERKLDRAVLYGGVWMKESTMVELKKGRWT